MEKFVQNLRISLDKDQYIRRQIPALLVKPAAAKVAPGTQTVPSEEQDLSDEAKILLRAAYESEQGILIRKVWGGSLRIHVSGYSFTVNAPAVIMRWEQAFKQLMMRQLISKNIRADNFWRLTDEGKKIAAELSDDLLLPLEKFKRTNSRIDA